MSDAPLRRWPGLPVAEWAATRDTLHLWTQVVGKVRLANEPTVNHWWNVPLCVSAPGLATSLIPLPTAPRSRSLTLVEIDRVFEVFRSRFVGKASPVHLFWGGLDLATTRFSGRDAPPYPAREHRTADPT